jgi:uncharacterized YigZ family protein
MGYSIASPVSHEVVIKKSRFIGCVQSVAGREQAQQVVDQLKQQHPGAAHVCWALMAGGQSAAVDDGEPSGTAGRPMLEVLRHHELESVLATVVRYFGGVKLGAGGLVRAYTDAVAGALLHADKIEHIATTQLHALVAFEFEGAARRLAAKLDATLQATHATQGVSLHIELPSSHAQTYVTQLNDISSGQAQWLERSA